MTGDRPAILALGAMVAAALIAGLLTVGGPRQGAMEKRDDARFSDLLQLENQINCVRNGREGALPDTLTPTAACDYGARTEDPITGETYRYERLDDDSYRLCADFENTARIAERAERRLGRIEDGCLTVTPEPWRARG